MYGTLEGPSARPPSRAGVQKRESGWLPCGNCCVTVPPDRYLAVERFGNVTGILESGLHCVGADCCGLCITFRSITRRVEQNECVIETKTKDNVFLLARVAVQQSVMQDHAQSAIYELADVSAQVDSYVADVVRSHLPRMTLDEAFENKDSISCAVQDALSQSMADYGFTIHKALVTELKPSQDVMVAMNEINKQKRLRDAAQMASEADKIRVVKKAEADRDAAMLQGEGIARQREAIIEGLKRSITGAEGAPSTDALSADRVSELLLITQYFETLKEIGANARTNTVFIPSSPAEGVRDIASQVRAGILQAAPAAAAPQQSEM
jgi:regulator of protease activity HflC (stomatin/prohibitin superfamily)